MRTYEPINLNVLPEKTRDNLVSYFQANPLQVEVVCPHVAGFDGVSPMDAPNFFITFGELLDSRANEPYEQDPVNPVRVAGLLIGGSATYPYPLKEVRTFLEPIMLGVLDSGLVFPSSGRHRITALATGYQLSGHDLNSAEVQGMLVPVVRKAYHPASVVLANKTRSVTKGEQASIKAQIKGVNVEDIDSITSAFAEGVFKIEEMFRHAAVLARAEGDDIPELIKGLTNATLGDIYASFASQYFREVKAHKPGKTIIEWSIKLLAKALTSPRGLAFRNLDKAIVAASKAAGGTKNYAYIATKIAYQLVLIVKDDMETPVKVTKDQTEMLKVLEDKKAAAAAKKAATAKPKRGGKKAKAEPEQPQEGASIDEDELCPV